MPSLRVLVLYGGRSGEHEVSVASARLVCDSLDALGHACIPVGVSRAGAWVQVDPRRIPDGRVPDDGPGFDLRARPGEREVDVAFPVLHGPFGEDGSIQGLFELAELPYVGAGVDGSVICLDKGLQKRVFQAAGIPVVGFVDFTRRDWDENSPDLLDRVEGLGFPVFVKPSRLGSSVGISKVERIEDVKLAVDRALAHDDLVIVEQRGHGREIEIGVLGDEPDLSVVGEVVPHADFYDYEAKYSAEGSDLRVPADIPQRTEELVRRYAAAAFRAAYCEGLARVDFFYDESSGDVQLNEINSIPGMTPKSMYPRVWEASGVPFPQVVARLLDHALARRDRRLTLEASRRAAHAEETGTPDST